MEVLFLGAIGLVTAITLLLAIMNWFYLTSIGSKVSNLEAEVEKKALEFESAKKERQALALASREAAQIQSEKMEPASSQSDSSQIEVVRNVRGAGFDHVDMETNHSYAGQSEMESTHDRYEQPVPVPPSPPREVHLPPARMAQTPTASPALPPQQQRAIVITLFSNAKQDTDFAAAWKKLSEMLPSSTNPEVRLDFRGVMFLYERELQYLEKFKSIILQAGGTVSFANCDPELLSILSKRPALAALATS